MAESIFSQPFLFVSRCFLGRTVVYRGSWWSARELYTWRGDTRNMAAAAMCRARASRRTMPWRNFLHLSSQRKLSTPAAKRAHA